MDRIAQGSISESWINDIGNKQLLFQGRGGTGKTAILLSLAWRLWKTKGARILVLTYNRALAADMNRLLTLMGMIDEVGAPLIKVQTVHSFLYRKDYIFFSSLEKTITNRKFRIRENM